MLTVTAMNLVSGDSGEQLGLFDSERDRRHERVERLEVAVDEIRGRFGSGAVFRGAVLGNDLGIEGAEATPPPKRHKDGNCAEDSGKQE